LMLMHDLPFAIDFATAKSGAHPDIGLFIIRPSTSNSIEAVAEGHVITRSDAQIANLVADRTSESRKPCFPVLFYTYLLPDIGAVARGQMRRCPVRSGT